MQTGLTAKLSENQDEDGNNNENPFVYKFFFFLTPHSKNYTPQTCLKHYFATKLAVAPFFFSLIGFWYYIILSGPGAPDPAEPARNPDSTKTRIFAFSGGAYLGFGLLSWILCIIGLLNTNGPRNMALGIAAKGSTFLEILEAIGAIGIQVFCFIYIIPGIFAKSDPSPFAIIGEVILAVYSIYCAIFSIYVLFIIGQLVEGKKIRKACDAC